MVILKANHNFMLKTASKPSFLQKATAACSDHLICKIQPHFSRAILLGLVSRNSDTVYNS